jgi:hypothetical protein
VKTITILPEMIDGNRKIFRAKTDGLQCTGKSAGEALDRLAAQLDPAESGTLVIIQPPLPPPHRVATSPLPVDPIIP